MYDHLSNNLEHWGVLERIYAVVNMNYRVPIILLQAEYNVTIKQSKDLDV